MDRSRGASVEDAGQEESEHGQYRKIAWPLRRVSENKSTRLGSDPLQEGEVEGEIALGPICLAFAVQQAPPLLRGPLERTSVVNGNILNSKGVHVGVVVGDEVFGLKGQKLYDLKGSNIYKLNGDLDHRFHETDLMHGIHQASEAL